MSGFVALLRPRLADTSRYLAVSIKRATRVARAPAVSGLALLSIVKAEECYLSTLIVAATDTLFT